MRTVQVSELKERLDEVIAAVRNGETVEIWEGEVCIAVFVPKVSAVDRSVEHPDRSGRNLLRVGSPRETVHAETRRSGG
jgi:antitoxin (DNA-binding transcriptional repressor) of toxin-antitoxin stability system